MPNVGVLRLGNVLGALAIALTDEIRDAMNDELKVGGSAAAALLMVGVEDGISVERIARQLRLAQPTIVRTIALLEEQGLLRKKRSSDRRLRPLSLTAKGERMAARLLDSRGRVLARFAEALTPSEQAAFSKSIEKLLAVAVQQEDQKYTICRLCNENVCIPQECPVERGALLSQDQVAHASEDGAVGSG